MNLLKRSPGFFDDDTFNFPTRFFERPLFNDAFLKRMDMPPVNIKENDKEYAIELAVPGYRKEDLHVDMEDGVLTISSERKEEKKEDKEEYKRREFSYSSFSRSFTLPQIADENKVTASFKDGILRLTVAKQKELVKAKAAKEIAIG